MHVKTKEPAAASFIKSNFYIDDGLISVENVDAAIKLVQEARLHKFISNDRKVMESIPVSERASGVQDVELGSDELPVQTVLGVKWSVIVTPFPLK